MTRCIDRFAVPLEQMVLCASLQRPFSGIFGLRVGASYDRTSRASADGGVPGSLLFYLQGAKQRHFGAELIDVLQQAAPMDRDGEECQFVVAAADIPRTDPLQFGGGHWPVVFMVISPVERVVRIGSPTMAHYQFSTFSGGATVRYRTSTVIGGSVTQIVQTVGSAGVSNLPYLMQDWLVPTAVAFLEVT